MSCTGQLVHTASFKHLTFFATFNLRALTCELIARRWKIFLSHNAFLLYLSGKLYVIEWNFSLFGWHCHDRMKNV